MSEFSAILALWSLRHLERELACRRQIAAIYHHRLRTIPGIQFQQVLEQSETNFCAFALEVDAQEFGLDTVALQNLLSHEGVETLRYFFPPMHKTRAYHQFNHLRLEQSEMLSQRNLCLPMHAHLTAEQAHAVCDAVEKIHLETAKYAARYGSQKTKNGAEEKQFSRKEWEEAVPARCAEADAIF